MFNDLLLLSGNDIPFEAGGIVIHPPTIKEIGLIGEDNFFMGCQLLNFSKDILSEKDKSYLSDKSNFDIFMSIVMTNKSPELVKQKEKLISVMTLLFPQYIFSFDAEEGIVFKQDGVVCGKITDANYEEFKKHLSAIICLGSATENKVYNPAGDKARALAEKFRKRQQKLSEIKGKEEKKIDILSRYSSILSIGMNINLNDIVNYTIYQLFDAYKRYDLKGYADYYVKACLAGAKGMKEPEDWTKDIHDQS